MQSARRCGQLAAAGAVVTALLAGCGSSSGNGTSQVTPAPGVKKPVSVQELLASSVTKTESAKNAKLHLDFKGTIAGQALIFSGDGVADFPGKKFDMTLNLPAITGISGAIEERLVGGKFYLKLPSAALGQTGGKPWVSIDASTFGGGSTSGLGSLGQDPTQYLNALKDVSDSITKVGTEDIRGVRTTHYRAEVDVAKAAAKTGSQVDSLDQIRKALGSTTLPEDVYLDDQGLARRMSVTITPKAGTSGAASIGSISTTVDMYDFGTTDTSGIIAPPASEVGTLATAKPGIPG